MIATSSSRRRRSPSRISLIGTPHSALESQTDLTARLPEIEELLRDEEPAHRHGFHQSGGSVEVIDVGVGDDDRIETGIAALPQGGLHRTLGDPSVLHRAGVVEQCAAGGGFDENRASMADR